MRMISRKQALEIVNSYELGPGDCAREWCSQGDCPHQIGEPCATFNSTLGIHDSYALIDVKNWLGF